jgi:hypothetical protein
MLPLYNSSTPSLRRPRKAFTHHSQNNKRSPYATLLLIFSLAFISLYVLGLCYFGYTQAEQYQVPDAHNLESLPPTTAAAAAAADAKPFPTTKPPIKLAALAPSSLPLPHPPKPVDPIYLNDNYWFHRHPTFSTFTQADLNTEKKVFVDEVSTKTQVVVLLGMHRSGTSLLGGLLHHALKLPVGPDDTLIGPAFDNKKGFFENVNIVLQNDDLMRIQRQDYGNVLTFSPVKAAKDVLALASPINDLPKNFNFNKGRKALRLYREYSTIMQKDPRMCITLPAWYPFMRKPPAVIFTYRHPLEVAYSMHTRAPAQFKLARVLDLWIRYNRAAIENTEGLCTVYTSASRVMEDPLREVTRIRDELKDTCKVEKLLEGAVDEKIVTDWVDASLKHEKSAENTVTESGLRGCTWPVWHNTDTTQLEKQRKHDDAVYSVAMQVFCDLESGAAFEKGYEWPKNY